MRPNANVAERQGDLGGQKIAMTFDQNSLAHLMRVMTDLYSDPELAVIREYSTNAWDSHKAAGVTRPIEVTLPNGLSPFFKVKDFGLGMDISDIENIYSQYGASTKRDTDDQVGMLGLGCKSALSYTQQFNVVAVKNGRKYNVAVSRTEDGSGMMEIVLDTETDEPNGVEIIVPVKRGHNFQRKAIEFYQFWEKGSVLVDGTEPNYISGREVKDGILMVPDLSKDYLVMGNVGYPLADNYQLGNRNYYSKYGVVARVDIGDVNFTPSRESLHYTKMTEATINRIREEFKAGLDGIVERDVAACKSQEEALNTYLEWYNLLGGGYNRYPFPDCEYQGKKVPLKINHPFLSYKVNHTRYAVDSHAWIDIKTARDTPIIYGFAGEKISGHQREKMRTWRTMNGFESNNILICDELPEILEEDWIPESKIYSWEDVKKAKAPGQKTGRPKAMFDVWLPGAVRIKSVTADDFPDDARIALVAPRDVPNNKVVLKFIEEHDDVMIVRLQSYRWDKFRKSYPQALNLGDMLAKMYNESVEALTDDDKFNLGLDYRVRSLLQSLNEAEINDPELVKAIIAAKEVTPSATLKRYEQMNDLFSGHYFVRRSSLNINRINPLEKYTLLQNSYYNYDVKHATVYINAAYEAFVK
ncbi:hypothetical protein SEA_BELFORT_166 [Streptomyces phage Belfort]|uniref:RIIA-like protein n=1 Tax=Streptomyces phage Belfort TaxID=2801887 RepID=A0A7T8C3A1_9CAUD|nr:hypothetical protein SEA_BELFORT_166 [Streptomyces phage Belfort]